MRPFVCETCGADLHLSLPDKAYLCDASPREHQWDRGQAEKGWLDEVARNVEQSPGDVDVVFQLASLCGRLASTSLRAGDPDPARVYMSQLVGVVELCHTDHPDDERVRAMLMEALVEQATVGEKLHDHAMAAGAYERLVPFAQADAESDPKNVEQQRNLSSCLNGAGRMNRAVGNGVAAKLFFEKDLAVLDHLAELYPEHPDMPIDRAVAHFNLYLVSTSRDEEIAHLDATLRILDRAPSGPMHEKIDKLVARAKAERERLANTDAMAPSRLAKATTQLVRGKSEEALDAPTNQRAWLVEQVDRTLRSRRKRLSVVR